jgi:hypothetical protein
VDFPFARVEIRAEIELKLTDVILYVTDEGL